MKKILTIIIALTLVLVMSGCEPDGTEFNYKNYYTQEEVDELIKDWVEYSLIQADFKDEANKEYLLEGMDILDSMIDDVDFRLLDYYTEDELDRIFDEIVAYTLELEARIEILEGE